jgi:peptidoglycan-N-acetylglucosamine deacetylase
VLALTAGAIIAVEGFGPAGSARIARASEPAPPPAAPHPAVRVPLPPPSGSATIGRLIQLGLPIYCAGPRGNAVAFTFDDGPGPYTSLALRKLARARERATFFVVGRSADNFPGYLPRELKVAAIGDHTYTHPQLTALSPSMVTWQLEHTAKKITAESGQHVELFRPPYGLHNAVVDRIARHLGLLEILWDVDSADSLGANYAQIIRTVEAGLRPGAIILMHENHGQTMRALGTLLPELHRRHLESVSVPELLAMDPPSLSQIRKGQAGCGVAASVARPGTGA